MSKKRVLIMMAVLAVICAVWNLDVWKKTETQGDEIMIRMKMASGKVKKMPLEEYLTGVVAAEMPADFREEALKAQAVAARTFAVRRLSQKTESDPGYDVDTTVLTQAWISDNQMYSKWGALNYWRCHRKIENAVKQTQDQALTVNGTYIEALYHSSSGRKPTERSEDVWSSACGYLINVTSGEDEPLRFVKQSSFTVQELYTKLNISGAPHPLTGGDVKLVARTAAGRVKSIEILGKIYPAVQIRSLLSLSSTDWEWSVSPDGITWIVYGNGHAVGMSQYGANDLAGKGYGYQEILGHYYPGAEITGIYG
jgi:stage II sporulation protein D